MTNETLETIKSRRSCRAYKPEQITDEELNAVLEAGTYAASAMGRPVSYTHLDVYKRQPL